MMSKRILSFVILVVMLITCSVPAFALTEFGSLRAIGIISDGIYAKGENELVTRAELAYITASLMDKNERPPMDTRFCDVDSSNGYSGYIEFLAASGIVSGTGGCAFIPNGNVTVDVANKMLLSAVGYGLLCEELGGYPEGYRTIARALGLNKGVSTLEGGNLTAEAVAVMVTNLLETPIPSMGIQTGDTSSELTEKDTSILGNVLGLSVYRGVVISCDKEKNTLKFEAEENVYDANPQIVNHGQVLMLKTNETTDGAYYVNVPVIVYVNEQKELVYIETQENTEVAYKIIAGVNGDNSKNSKYSISNINEITFVGADNRYEVSDSAILRYNNNTTRASVRLTGNTARVVTVEEEIVYIETWDFTEGGIITDINAGNITYTKGSENGLLLKDIHKLDEVFVIINSKPSVYSAIKTDSLFDYYLNDDLLVLNVSDRIVSDTFKGVSTSGVELGYISYDTLDVYYSADGNKYTKNSGYLEILDILADAYVGPDGYVRYIKPADINDIEQDKFYGIVIAAEKETFTSNARVKLWKVADGTLSQKIYEIDKNTLYSDSITMDELILNSSDFDAKGVYVFETNANGIIRKISRPKKVRGFETVTCNGSDPMVFYGDGNRLIYPDGVKFVGLYKNKDGEFIAESIKSADLKGKTATKLDFYSVNGDLEVSFALVKGDMASLESANASSIGILIGKKDVFRDNDIMTELTFIMGSGKNTYLVDKDTAKELKINSRVTFKSASSYSEEDIVISASSPLSDDIEQWQVSEEETGFHFAYVDDISENMIAFSDGNVYSIYANMSYCAEYDASDNKNPIKPCDLKYISKGDYVYYYARKYRDVYSVFGLVAIR